MGVPPQELVVEKGNDAQSTVSSHPAFDARNLVHFMESVDEQQAMDNDGDMFDDDGQQEYVDGMVTGHEYKDDDGMSLSSATSNSLDEYSYSKSNEEQYIPNDAISLASSDHDARYRVGSRRLRVKNGINSKFDNLKLIANIVEDEIMNVLDGHDTRTVTAMDCTDNVERRESQECLRFLFDKMHNDCSHCTALHTEHHAAAHPKWQWAAVRGDIYGVIMSFMGRHDRFLHCRLVCKLWNKLVYDQYWIYPSNLSRQQINALRPGM